MKPELANCSLEEPDQFYFETDEAFNRHKKIQCPDDERSWFRNIHLAYCSSRFGTTGFTCVENNREKIQKRVKNQVLMEKMTSYAQKKFQEYKGQLTFECCGDKKNCTTRLNGLTLGIDPDTRPEARYESNTEAINPTRNKIVISLGKLASAYNTENIDRVILVEMAHACQFALISEDEKKYEQFTSPDTRCDKAAGLISFKEGLGEELGQCLIDELESQMKEIPEAEQKNYCFGKWYREAFSDMKFRGHFTSIYHWTFDMGRRSIHTNYGSVYKYIKCGYPKDFKKNLCR